MSRYAFAIDETASFEDVMGLIAADPALSDDLRAQLAGVLSTLLDNRFQPERFAVFTAHSLPYAPEIVAGLLRTYTGDPSARARIEVAVVAINRRYNLGTRMRFKAHASWAAGIEQFPNHVCYRRRQLQRFMAYHSDSATAEETLRPGALLTFEAALSADPSVQHPENLAVDTRRALNWAVRAVKDWPSIKVPMPKVRDVKGLPWTAFPPGLRAAVEATLQRKPRFIDWDDEIVGAFERDPSGLSHSVNLIRIGLGTLVSAGVPADTFRTAGDIAPPDRFELLANELRKEAAGAVNRLVRTKMATFYSLAVRSASLDRGELETIKQEMADIDKRARHYSKMNPSRRERATRQAVPAETLTAMLEQLHEIFAAPLPARVTRKYAASMKQAVMLALRIETGFSSVTIGKIEMARHMHTQNGDLGEQIRFLIPANENANRIERTGILSPRTTAGVTRFIGDFRPSLDISTKSRFLFPGIGAAPLRHSTISTQQIHFLKNKLACNLTPECIRLLIEQLILKRDAAATAVVGDVLGLRDTEYVAKRAKPYRERQKREAAMQLTATGMLK